MSLVSRCCPVHSLLPVSCQQGDEEWWEGSGRLGVPLPRTLPQQKVTDEAQGEARKEMGEGEMVLLLKLLTPLASCCHSLEGQIPEKRIREQPAPQQPTLDGGTPRPEWQTCCPSEPGPP